MGRYFCCFLVILCAAGPFLHAETPRHIYLTWEGDTSRTIMVNYQTYTRGESQVLFDTTSREGQVKKYRYQALGTSHRIQNHPDQRYIHWVHLTDLKPGKTYYFVVGDEQSGFSTEQKFKTIDDSGPITFVTGGDMGTGPLVFPMMKHAASHDPEFGLVGGDIAYANDELKNYKLWDIWLDSWRTNMVTRDGLMIPMVLGIGNHEVKGGLAVTGGKATFYFGYFAQQGASYFSKTFGDNLVIYALDSGHIVTHGGEQSEWLEEVLARDRDKKYKFAVYHAPFYPTYRQFNDIWAVSGRSYWLPLFDRYELTTAFENHDHTYKRSPLLRANKVDPKGTLYLGNGCWGKEPRPVTNAPRWFEIKAGAIAHYWKVDVRDKGVEYRAYDHEGQLFDVYPENLEGAENAQARYQYLIRPQHIKPPGAR